MLTYPRHLPSLVTPPTDEEIAAARYFDEPLVAIPLRAGFACDSVAENLALATALNAWAIQGDLEDTAVVSAFLADHPESAWRVSLLTNLGTFYYRTGYFTRALASYEEAWKLGKAAEGTRARATVDRAVGDLALLYARLGRMNELEALLGEIRATSRDVRGAGIQRLRNATEGLSAMKRKPGESFLCGPYALKAVLAASRSRHTTDPRLALKSTTDGTSLAQLLSAAREVGERYEVVRWETTSSLPTPAVVHFKAGHFAAVTGAHSDCRFSRALTPFRRNFS